MYFFFPKFELQQQEANKGAAEPTQQLYNIWMMTIRFSRQCGRS